MGAKGARKRATLTDAQIERYTADRVEWGDLMARLAINEQRASDALTDRARRPFVLINGRKAERDARNAG